MSRLAISVVASIACGPTGLLSASHHYAKPADSIVVSADESGPSLGALLDQFTTATGQTLVCNDSTRQQLDNTALGLERDHVLAPSEAYSFVEAFLSWNGFYLMHLSTAPPMLGVFSAAHMPNVKKYVDVPEHQVANYTDHSALLIQTTVRVENVDARQFATSMRALMPNHAVDSIVAPGSSTLIVRGTGSRVHELVSQARKFRKASERAQQSNSAKQASAEERLQRRNEGDVEPTDNETGAAQADKNQTKEVADLSATPSALPAIRETLEQLRGAGDDSHRPVVHAIDAFGSAEKGAIAVRLDATFRGTGGLDGAERFVAFADSIVEWDECTYFRSDTSSPDTAAGGVRYNKVEFRLSATPPIDETSVSRNFDPEVWTREAAVNAGVGDLDLSVSQARFGGIVERRYSIRPHRHQLPLPLPKVLEFLDSLDRRAGWTVTRVALFAPSDAEGLWTFKAELSGQLES